MEMIPWKTKSANLQVRALIGFNFEDVPTFSEAHQEHSERYLVRSTVLRWSE